MAVTERSLAIEAMEASSSRTRASLRLDMCTVLPIPPCHSPVPAGGTGLGVTLLAHRQPGTGGKMYIRNQAMEPAVD
ncbi:hypothetical protein GCM10017711_09800 [Paeniglutamicibacter sulfureus]